MKPINGRTEKAETFNPSVANNPTRRRDDAPSNAFSGLLTFDFLSTAYFLATTMGKGKKKHSKKDDVADDILDVAAVSVRKFRKVTKEIHKLSTGQKIVGGLALLAAGLTYMAKQNLDADHPAASGSADTAQLASAQPDESEAEAKPSPPRKSRKAPKAKHEG